MFYEWQNGHLLLRIKVQANASKDEFCDAMGQQLKVRISAPPVDGKANQYLIKFLAKQLRVSKSQVELVSGETSREKRFKIFGLSCVPAVLKEKDNVKKRR